MGAPPPARVKALDRPRPLRFTPTARWAVLSLALAVLLILVVWLVVTESPLVGFIVRLYRDKHFLKDTVASWGWLAPLVFIVIQALQVVLSPIPGEITGPVGGALFGTWGGSSTRRSGSPPAPSSASASDGNGESRSFGRGSASTTGTGSIS